MVNVGFEKTPLQDIKNPPPPKVHTVYEYIYPALYLGNTSRVKAISNS